MRRRIIAGNWKMNGDLAETGALIHDIVSSGCRGCQPDMVICPPFPCLQLASSLLVGSKIALGAQDLSAHESGAYTGEVSAAMLLTVGVTYVILGHSERRQYHGEDDKLINAKAKAALSAGLTPIICFGETLKHREAGQTEELVGQQVDGTLADFSTDMLTHSVLAYEPVWAIGTGKTATPDMAQAVHQFVRRRVAQKHPEAAAELPILYGGSVKPDNAAGLFEQPDIDGALVGGASLKAAGFLGIVTAG